MSPKDEPFEGNVKDNKFQLSAEAEKVAWREWQVRLNEQIGKALEKLVTEGKIPLGASGLASYTVADDGRFVFNCNAQPAAYAHIIAAALNDTFKNHRDLLKFPKGTQYSQITRTPTFSVGTDSIVTTGGVADEVTRN